MGIPENTTYGGAAAPATSSSQAVARAATNFAANLPKRRAKRPVSMGQFQPTLDAINAPQASGTINPSGKYDARSLGTVTTPYGGSTRFEEHHPGVDIAKGIGTPLPAFVDGPVVEVATGRKQGDQGYGNYIVQRDSQGNLHRYSHLSRVYVKKGDRLKKGQTYGLEGNSGSTYSNSGGTGAHLDYRIQNMYGKYIDPKNFIDY